eukprot:RCo041242
MKGLGEPEFSRTTVMLSVASYSACSGGMLLINKLALHFFPLPSTITLVQLVFCVAVLHLFQAGGLLQLDALTWSKIRPYMVYNVAFAAYAYANMRALQDSGVDTVILFRCCSPLVIAVLDWAFLGRALPSWRSTFSLVLICVGGVGFVEVDGTYRALGFRAYTWCLIYLALLCFLICFGKQMVASLKLNGTTGHVYYTNLLSIPIMIAMVVGSGELERLPSMTLSRQAWFFLALSSIVGVAISWTGWHCRTVLSATGFTIVGVMCKLIPIVGNTLMWDKHANYLGLAYLLLALFGGSVYEQAPLRQPKSDPSAAGPGKNTGILPAAKSREDPSRHGANEIDSPACSSHKHSPTVSSGFVGPGGAEIPAADPKSSAAATCEALGAKTPARRAGARE